METSRFYDMHYPLGVIGVGVLGIVSVACGLFPPIWRSTARLHVLRIQLLAFAFGSLLSAAMLIGLGPPLLARAVLEQFDFSVGPIVRK